MLIAHPALAEDAAEAFEALANSAGQLGIPAITMTETETGGTYTVTLQILVMMTVLTLLPSMLMMMTSFTRIIIVFSILRQALGLQQTPSNQVMVGLALFLSLFIMTPVFEEANRAGLQPYLAEEITPVEAAQAALVPFREFMLSQTREDDLALFLQISRSEKPDTVDDVSFFVLAPAFVTSELKTAFQIGFLLFIPFLVIDLVVASVLMSMGMMMLSPIIISLPFKLMLFVLVDGWAMVIGSLAGSFGL
ncbi:MAG: flagellar biosynthetic protein FliP [Candidatus Azotimanducaceae bacterium]|jgi:flagellar biosynthetic protein FliP